MYAPRVKAPARGQLGGRGRRGTPIMTHTGRLRQKGVPFSEVRISLVAVCERVGKSVISICKRVKKG